MQQQEAKQFGLECARQALRNVCAGMSPHQNRVHIVETLFGPKEAELRRAGAEDDEIVAFLNAADNACVLALNGAVLNRKQRRAMRHRR